MFRIYFKTNIPPGVLKRDFTDAMKKAIHAPGVMWHSKFRQKHFTRRGAAEYRYSGRTTKYMKAKRKENPKRIPMTKGHDLPLVWTGMSRMLTRTRDIRVTGRGQKVTVRIVISAPGLNRRPRGGRINLREEMTTVSAAEETRMVDRLDRELQKQLEHMPRRPMRRR